jgi:putative aldouronate transport system permease protein
MQALSPVVDDLKDQASRFVRYLPRLWPLYVMVIPALIHLVLLSYYPMYGIRIAFQDYKPALGFDKSPWVGLKQFQLMLENPSFWQIFRNTIVIATSKIITLQFCAVVLALLLNEVRKLLFKRSVQSLVYLPYFLSWIVSGGIMLEMLGSSGVVNQVMQRMGQTEPVIFLGNNRTFVPTLIVSHLWQQVGWGTILYLAALTSIDPQLLEAAAIDGAGRFQRVLYIILPGILPTLLLVLCLDFGLLFNAAGFDQVLNLYNPAVYSTSDILDTWIYREGLLGARFSLATAVGLVRSVLGLILIVISLRLISRFTDYQLY